MFFGTAFIGLSGTSFPVLNGNFSAGLVPGASPFTTLTVSASLAQTGVIPSDVGILQFEALTGGGPTVQDYFGVYMDGQRLQVLPMIDQPGTIRATFTADISAYAGHEVNLRFTSFFPYSLILDDIAFVPIPEPSTVSLLACAGLGLGFAHWRFRLRK